MKMMHSTKKPTAALHAFTLVVLLLATGNALHQKALGDKNYTAATFTTEYQLRNLLSRNADDLRVCHGVLVRSRKLLLAQKAAFICRDLWLQDKNNPKRMALYSCAYTVANANSGLDRFTREQERLLHQLQPFRKEADDCLNQSVLQLPQSAEVQAMASVGLYNQAQFDNALALAEQAVKLDPAWPYAHFWLSSSLISTIHDHPSEAKKRAGRALAEMQWVEKHAPTLARGRELHYMHIYSNLQRYPEAIAYMDKAIAKAEASRPWDRQQIDWESAKPVLLRWRQSLVAEAR